MPPRNRQASAAQEESSGGKKRQIVELATSPQQEKINKVSGAYLRKITAYITKACIELLSAQLQNTTLSQFQKYDIALRFHKGIDTAFNIISTTELKVERNTEANAILSEQIATDRVWIQDPTQTVLKSCTTAHIRKKSLHTKESWKSLE